jgi:hypothetical protein
MSGVAGTALIPGTNIAMDGPEASVEFLCQKFSKLFGQLQEADQDREHAIEQSRNWQRK